MDGFHYKHVAEVNLTSSGGVASTSFLTSGRMAVTEIEGWDEDGGKVYFTATGEGDPVRGFLLLLVFFVAVVMLLLPL